MYALGYPIRVRALGNKKIRKYKTLSLVDKLAGLRQAERYILFILVMRDFHIYISGGVDVPLRIRSIQTITQGRGSISIRRVERRNVLLQLALHLRCVRYFRITYTSIQPLT